ncbi:sucrase/ferredoxin domain-containing protein [Delitschia confertaspora ATCC 74209]|uniref:Defect at low temperature protein 1 n=1 Tax=Delitschia confertaspora ATCC 74209 TaxID=1513339 RepID=A0A9P4JCP6_9PLEO|nr:sucrase/ferredoxin domain-containing protein [Delitschia confertaspora ATCC 74209]
MRIPFFRIWYSTTYTVLFFILIVLLAVTPGDTIYQSIRNNEIQKIFVVAGVYLLTFFITVLIYSTRLYTNRTVLQAIPKPYIPVEDGEVGRMVRRMIVKALRRSAIVAWDSRPRDVREEVQRNSYRTGTSHSEEKGLKLWHRSHVETTILPVSPTSPPWGYISHPGWGSPTSDDFPNLEYWRVIPELPNLIEAKAVSLAPPDPALDIPSHVEDTTPLLPDAQVVALLQRPATMGLRDYLGRLSSYGLINPPSLGPQFLSQYEYARFSTHPLTETEFGSLMAVFAEVLNGMTELHPEIIEEARAEYASSDTHSLAPSQSSSNSTGSAIRYRTPRMGDFPPYGNSSSSRNGSESPQTLRTAPSMFRNSNHGARSIPATPSLRSYGSGSVRIHPVRSPSTILPNSSTSSLGSGSGGSVVRLNINPAEGELPYQFQLDTT